MTMIPQTQPHCVIIVLVVTMNVNSNLVYIDFTFALTPQAIIQLLLSANDVNIYIHVPAQNGTCSCHDSVLLNRSLV